jgi:hypothetical protein
MPQNSAQKASYRFGARYRLRLLIDPSVEGGELIRLETDVN